ncbi:hypothetical protein EYF80_066540 [Liparis tanakae]|uniref:Uncharacterized protein n=1 Tax=Liparis tanakae TaxID=230148 RepID=A0A4Z2E3N8_9TELE|nr:hypothetical protein EYF80_066540 [Liparis tanakae]
MSFNGTSLWLSGYPWCLGGKPTGSGKKSATLEPNVGPPGTQRLEGMEPGPDEELMNSLGQILARMEEMRRAQVEENRLFLKALLDPPALWMTPVPCAPSARRPSPFPRDPSPQPTPGGAVDPQGPVPIGPAGPRAPGPVGAADRRAPGAVGGGDLRAVRGVDL